ncbi:MAG: hypothetical protein EAZ35_03005 [Sphingobacteriia bacterium]|nr:MAG: hypothetical protein EAZ41_06215 [Sphingobacteriia bacterium]TAG31634.1 MAG: hypothetical protein EAZ35_03005 [Sphingobacteriia bacterium]
MKKILLFASISAFILTTSCNNETEKKDIHTHDDGSTHADHDTSKLMQHEFNAADTTIKDTTAHTHAGEKKHSH